MGKTLPFQIIHQKQKFMKTENSSIPMLQVSFVPNICPSERKQVTQSYEVYELSKEIWDSNTIMLFEEFKAIFLDRRNGVIGWRMTGLGSTDQVIANVQLIFAIAVQCNASSLILVHNHPSSSLTPSQSDIGLTNRICEGCKLFNIKLLDHLIITKDRYYSFSDEGMLWPMTHRIFCGSY